MKQPTLLVALLCLWEATGFTPNAGVINVLTRKSEENGLEIDITPTNGPFTHGLLGLSLPSSVGQWTNCINSTDYLCATWGDFATVRLSPGKDPNHCTRVEWTSPFARELQDCFDISPSVHWYGGGEVYTQHWPVETQPQKDSAFLSGLSDGDLGGVLENYWLLSSGAFIVIDPTTPLYHSINTTHANRVCFTSRDTTPYNKQSPLTFNYEVCTGTDVKDAHQLAMSLFFGRPTGMPDERMMVKPFWSTWAEYKTDVNESIVLEYARRVVSEGFESSHIEIDDRWEGCYGDLEFDNDKFPDPKGMVDEVKGLGMRVTVWVHPFVNYGCREFDEGFKNGYFVNTPRGKTAITDWWQGSISGAIDVTNTDAVKWWTDRLRKLQATTGVDSFKFDAGEVTWLPSSISFSNESIRGWPNPNVYTTAYVDTVFEFGGLIETRAGHLNQNAPVFVRMLDKASNWGYGNGLRSLIPTLLLFGVLGYPFVLPDMIGGNAYGERPGKELYVRWMEANVFMPGVQFSLVPWGYDQETVEICLKVLELREQYSDVILDAARQAVEDGSPINRPVWWVAPNDTVTFTIDDAYMLGDTILVAPVFEEGAVSRDIYLPQGTWRSGDDSSEYVGPTWVVGYPAPLDVVPFFVKIG